MIGDSAPTEPPGELVAIAIAAACASPCRKSQRGVVLFDRRGGDVGVGFNGLPAGGSCTDTDACRKACNRRCVHAEQRAIRDAIARGWARPTSGAMLELASGLHVKVENGQLVAGGGPSCAECAREMLDVGLEYFWLFEVDGGPRWRRYELADFHARSVQAAGLPPVVGIRRR